MSGRGRPQPALGILLLAGPDNMRSSRILIPEHAKIRQLGKSAPENLYIFRPRWWGYSPARAKVANALHYACIVNEDRIVFRYELADRSTMITIADPVRVILL